MISIFIFIVLSVRVYMPIKNCIPIDSKNDDENKEEREKKS